MLLLQYVNLEITIIGFQLTTVKKRIDTIHDAKMNDLPVHAQLEMSILNEIIEKEKTHF